MKNPRQQPFVDIGFLVRAFEQARLDYSTFLGAGRIQLTPTQQRRLERKTLCALRSAWRSGYDMGLRSRDPS